MSEILIRNQLAELTFFTGFSEKSPQRRRLVKYEIIPELHFAMLEGSCDHHTLRQTHEYRTGVGR
tara:strand:- start:312 stop:506 length:195 start_codon:yes stop_codon:yes gene_type:complete